MLLSLLAVVLLTALLVGGLGFVQFRDTLNREARRNLESLTYAVAQALLISSGQVGLNPDRLPRLAELGSSRFRVIRGEQVFLEIGGRFPTEAVGWLKSERALAEGFVLQGALETRTQREALQAFWRTELLALPVSLLLVLLVVYLLHGYLMWPLRYLTDAAHAIAQQRFPKPVPVPPGRDELADLANSFNRMARAVEGYLERERNFSRYTSHELRTPLATLRAQVEALEQGLLSLEESLPAIKGSLERLERLLAGLLALTRSPQKEPQPVEVGKVLGWVVQNCPPEERARLILEGELRAQVLGYEELLQQALGNLVSNALKFSQGSVRVEVAQGTMVHIRVLDRGPGVPEEMLSRLGEPFLRAHPRLEGMGLGLALVRHIAALLGGSLEFRNRAEGGLEATLSLPRLEVKRV
ncbi:HAMP domain-containing sensor histidine kinase [Meiothermus rufus]|uniref:HAMP domain-containing sensor histidine kinase n=1 Tax=Meiothermus rufus TaxID=604332 RepID=UPI0003FF5378|nr:ATP-binding protein [Meiothermus rufus]